MSSEVKQNKYSSLISNTILFAVGGFAPKLLSLILLPIVTRQLVPSDSSIALNMIGACNLILPIMYLCINEAIIRFGPEKGVMARDVYTTGILVVLGGFAVLLCFYPFVSKISFFDGHINLLYAFVLASALHTVTNHYVRSQGHVRLFATDGIVISCLNVFFIIIFLVVLKMGVVGYLLATILPDALSTLYLSIMTKTWQDFSIKDLNRIISKKMLAYSIPLVPAAVSWWITNMSDRFLITHYLGNNINGIYSYADRIPQLLLLVSAIFIQAWQISAFSESDYKEGERFYSSVYKSYSALIFLAGSGIIMLLRPMTKILLSAEYYEAWSYSPFLIMSVMFSCLVTFLGTIYNFSKKNGMVTLTTVFSGVLDVILNIIMIPKWGIQGATISTLICYVIVFVIRAVDTRKYMKIDIQPFRVLFSTLIILGQVIVCLKQPKFGMLVQVAIFMGVFAFNAKNLLFILRQVMSMLYRQRNKAR